MADFKEWSWQLSREITFLLVSRLWFTSALLSDFSLLSPCFLISCLVSVDCILSGIFNIPHSWCWVFCGRFNITILLAQLSIVLVLGCLCADDGRTPFVHGRENIHHLCDCSFCRWTTVVKCMLCCMFTFLVETAVKKVWCKSALCCIQNKIFSFIE